MYNVKVIESRSLKQAASQYVDNKAVRHSSSIAMHYSNSEHWIFLSSLILCKLVFWWLYPSQSFVMNQGITKKMFHIPTEFHVMFQQNIRKKVDLKDELCFFPQNIHNLFTFYVITNICQPVCYKQIFLKIIIKVKVAF